MNPHALLGIGGGLLVVLAVLLQFGVVPTPGAVIGCGPAGVSVCGPPSLTAGFTWAANGPTLSVHDTSLNKDGMVSVVAVNFTWGDSAVTTNLPSGISTSHTYGAIGAYTVTESVVGYVGHLRYAATASTALSVYPAGGGGGHASGNVTTNQTCLGPAVSYCASFVSSMFQVKLSVLNATFTDQSVLSNMRLVALTWNFGDGVTSNGQATGAILHFYTNPGTYRVTENITATGVFYPNSAQTMTKSYAQNVTVTVNGNGTASQPGPFILNGWAAATGVVGIALLLALIAPGIGKILVIVGGLVFALALLTFTWVGGVL